MLELETVEEIDEAIRHTLATPSDQRGALWAKWLDSLLDKRNAVEAKRPAKHVVFSGGSR